MTRERESGRKSGFGRSCGTLGHDDRIRRERGDEKPQGLGEVVLTEVVRGIDEDELVRFVRGGEVVGDKAITGIPLDKPLLPCVHLRPRLHAAMRANDRDAIRQLMAARDAAPDAPSPAAVPAAGGGGVANRGRGAVAHPQSCAGGASRRVRFACSHDRARGYNDYDDGWGWDYLLALAELLATCKAS